MATSGRLPDDLRQKARRIPTSCFGVGTAHWSASITISMWRPGDREDARRYQPPRLTGGIAGSISAHPLSLISLA